MAYTWINRLLAFANKDLSSLHSSADVLQLRRSLGMTLHGDGEFQASDGFLPSGAFLDVTGVRFTAYEARRAQDALIKRLDGLRDRVTPQLCLELQRQVAASQKAGRVRAVSRFMPRAVLEGPQEFTTDVPFGKPTNYTNSTDWRLDSYVVYRPTLPGLWSSIVIAELISQGLGGRIRRCELQRCRDFFAVIVRRGSERRFCSDAHSAQPRVEKRNRRRKK